MGQAAARVLLIDDDQKLLNVMRELLESRGYAVEASTQSAEVLARLKAQAYDLVLMDVRMPGLEGTELLPLIKKAHPELPVILVSAFCHEANAAYYFSLGASDLVGKPFSHEALLEAVARALDQQTNVPLTITSLSLREARDQLYRKLIVAALRKANWNQVKAAEILGVSRYCLIRWMKKLGVAY